MGDYHLLQIHGTNSLDIILADKYVNAEESRNAVILYTGDLELLVKMKTQLEGQGYLFIERLCNQSEEYRAESPLLDLIKVVETTSSGCTKYALSPNRNDDESEIISNSETDPYAELEMSEDDYVPSSEEASCSSSYSAKAFNKKCVKAVKRQLFENKEMVLLSTLDREVIEVTSIEPATPSSEISEISVVPQSLCDGSTSNDSLVAVVYIQNNKMEIDLLKPMHKGKQKTPLFMVSERNCYRGYFRQKSENDTHICTPKDPLSEVVCQFERHGQTFLKLVLLACCSKGKLIESSVYTDENGISVGTMSYVKTNFQFPIAVKTTKGKQHRCYFCKEARTSMSKHIEKAHKNEPEVIALKSLTGAARRKAFDQLRLQGDRQYNITVDLQDRISVRQPSTYPVADSIHCPTCGGLFSSKNFCKHEIRCSQRLPDGQKRVNYLRYKERSQLKTDALLDSLLLEFRNDEISRVATSDDTILKLGAYLIKSNTKQHNRANCRSQMRRCARLLIEMRNIDSSVREFKDAIICNKYDVIMKGIRNVCQTQGTLDNFKCPTVALQFGPILTHIVTRLQIECLRNGGNAEHPTYKSLCAFQKFHASEFKTEITRTALVDAKINKFKGKKPLPTPEDIKLLYDHMVNEGRKAYDYLRCVGFEIKRWRILGRTLLGRFLLFNRRRPGEASRILLENYKAKEQIRPEDYKTLTRLETILADHYKIMYIIGKRNRILPVLMKPEEIQQLDLFVSFRKEANVAEDNPYLFPSKERVGHISADATLKAFARACGAKDSDSLTGTHLRKQLATMSQILNLNENEMQQIADFMGHDLGVHNMHYRLPEMVTQITKLSKFMAVVGDPDIYKLRGKTLDELLASVPDNDDGGRADDEDEGEASEEVNDSEVEEINENELSIPELFDGTKNTGQYGSSNSPDHIRPSTTQECSELSKSQDCPFESQEDLEPSKSKCHLVSSKVKDRLGSSQCLSPRTPKKRLLRKTWKLQKSPNSLALLRMLENPSNRRVTPVKGHSNSDSTANVEKGRLRNPTKAYTRSIPWSSAEIELVRRTFQQELKTRCHASQADCQKLLNCHKDVFHPNRTVGSIWGYIHNRVRNKISRR